MTRRMNHMELAFKKRLNREARARKAERNRRDKRDREEPTWSPLGFGKYRALCIPELFFVSPDYFYWALSNNVFRGRLEHQAWIVDSKSKHVLPPRSEPNQWEFLIELENRNVFKNFRIVKRTPGNTKNKDGLIRSKHLDVSIVGRQGRSMEASRQKMVARIKEEFFAKQELTGLDYQQFFDSDENFDLDCRETHCPRIPRRQVRLKKQTGLGH